MTDSTNFTSDNEFLALLRKQTEIQTKRFEREEKERFEKEYNHELRVESRKRGDAQDAVTLRQRQANCDHRKGTTGGKKFKVLDYMVSRYTFQNGLTRIKCEKCRMRWYKGDTKQHLLRDGKHLPNHTGISYVEAWSMSDPDNTTNTPGRCEMVTDSPVPKEQVA